ncbi:hypothetical protein N7468_008162 [Penicillium chermesinum]|uniref:DNA polymerase eta n=1 Tax=Penicillium chermesinum TaxID=63820 RepID=A0A9W9NPE4_9EURO|nr:uncharacterized protein N7468_008162 [Penicillium chermesinum]KAJ5223620.1 hypothetical protein N7468_008162 [Penicillium chermesinum]
MSSADPPSPEAVKTSRYTHRHLHLLRQGSTATPLRTIAHIDLDAFYAQCEMVRLGTPRDTPLAVVQWGSLIAVNYAARPSGITRMVSASEARSLCPNIVLQHVATFREGEGGRWAYRDGSARDVKTEKVSLDPYRAESRKILRTMESELQRWRTDESEGDLYRLTQGLSAGLEKASIDEVFIDLSPLVYCVLLRRYPELRVNALVEKRDEALPPPPTTALEWHPEECLIDLDTQESEEDNPDWDDLVMLTAGEIVRSVRKAVWDNLQYTCSAGIGRNKMIAKLGSACNKPNKQTLVRNRAVRSFLSSYKFTQIRMLGGKLGDQIKSYFGTDQVSDLLNVSLEQFRAKLDDHTATWLYGIIRGEDRSEVNPRTEIKSMLSAKSFRPSINSVEQAEKWLRIFAADIYGRLVQDGILETRRLPRVITLYHRVTVMRSRQLPIPGSSSIDEDTIFSLAQQLLQQVVADGQAWPCSNLSLSVSSFHDGITKNKAIEDFLVRGDQAKSLSHSSRPREPDSPDEQASGQKKQRVDNGGIKRFFNQQTSSEHMAVAGEGIPGQIESDPGHADSGPALPNTPEPPQDSLEIPHFFCERCSQSISEIEREEHDDWHFAKDLQMQDRQEARSSQPLPRPAASSKPSNPRGRGGRGRRRKAKCGWHSS